MFNDCSQKSINLFKITGFRSRELALRSQHVFVIIRSLLMNSDLDVEGWRGDVQWCRGVATQRTRGTCQLDLVELELAAHL